MKAIENKPRNPEMDFVNAFSQNSSRVNA